MIFCKAKSTGKLGIAFLERFRSLLCPAILLCSTAVSGVAQANETSKTEEFLSDGGRVGTLVGSILLGAATANPFAPLLGSVVGFVVGGYVGPDDEADTDSASYARRNIIPDGSSGSLVAAGGVPTLALAGPAEPIDTDSAGVVLMDTSKSNEKSEEQNGEVMPVANGENETVLESTESVDASTEGSDDETVVETKPVKREPVNLVITKEVGRTQDKLDAYAKIIREERDAEVFEPNPQCPSADAPRYRKKLAIAGFPLEHPEQSVFGGLRDVGKAVSTTLYQRFEQSDQVQAFSAPQWQMYASRTTAPTMMIGSGNKLGKYSAVSREMGAQFVLSGVIRSVGINDPGAWSTDYSSKIKGALFGSDNSRNFEVDIVVHDGYTGRVVMEKHYSGSGRWDVERTDRTGFGSPRFIETGYGQAVEKVLENMTSDVIAQLDCQPMIVPIIEVTGKDLLLDVGTPSGLLPGAKMRLVRAEGSLARPDEPAQLWDTDVELHIHSLALDSARAWMPKLGSHINIQKGDYAVIY